MFAVNVFFELYYNVSIGMIVRAIHETLYFNRRNDTILYICRRKVSTACPGISVKVLLV